MAGRGMRHTTFANNDMNTRDRLNRFSRRMNSARTDVFVFVVQYFVIWILFIVPGYWEYPDMMLNVMFWLLVGELVVWFLIRRIIPRDRWHEE
jgi:hypothetical protein